MKHKKEWNTFIKYNCSYLTMGLFTHLYGNPYTDKNYEKFELMKKQLIAQYFFEEAM